MWSSRLVGFRYGTPVRKLVNVGNPDKIIAKLTVCVGERGALTLMFLIHGKGVQFCRETKRKQMLHTWLAAPPGKENDESHRLPIVDLCTGRTYSSRLGWKLPVSYCQEIRIFPTCTEVCTLWHRTEVNA